MKSFSKINIALLVFILSVFLILPGSTLAADKVLKKDAECGHDQAYTVSGDSGAFMKYITEDKKIKLSSGQTSIKCESGTECLPDYCFDSTTATNGKAMQFICKDPNKDYSSLCGGDGSIKVSGYGSKEVEACKKGTDPYSSWLSNCQQTIQDEKAKKATEADCIKKAPKERGIFTRGLSDKCLGCGDCTQCDIFQVIASLAAYIFGIAGGLAVLLMINSAIGYITSGGNEEARGKAKKGLTAVIVGLIIVLVAWLLVNTILTQLLNYKKTTFGDWFAPNFKCSSSVSTTGGKTILDK